MKFSVVIVKFIGEFVGCVYLVKDIMWVVDIRLGFLSCVLIIL